MRQLALLIALYIIPFHSIGQDHPCPEALFRYWEFRDRFLKHFVRLDYWGDGIGQWDAENLRYEKAGYGLPAARMKMVSPSCYGYYNCYLPPEVLDCQSSNVLSWGDATIGHGHYLAMLATEYELLRKNKQWEQSQKTLHELWLALQAYRRLDMTANRLYEHWRAKYAPDCHVEKTIGMCGIEVSVPNYSGYSGFFIRDDVPHSFKGEFIESSGNEKSWEVGSIGSDYACMEDNLLGKFLPDENSRSGDLVLSQDQMIALLFGLAFVKRFIPDSVEIFGMKPVDMAKKIAVGMLQHIHPADETFSAYRSIRYPGCLSDTQVERGPNASNFYLAINYAIAYINDEAPICVDGEDGQKWEAFSKRACDCDLPFYENCGFNCRMLLELLAVTDDDKFDKIQEKAYNLEKEAFILARFQLHSNKYKVTELKPFIKTKFHDVICKMPPNCQGPCYKSSQSGESYFECPNIQGWCAESRIKGSSPDQTNCIFERNESLQGNGIDYLFSYNLYLLTYFPDAPFFNPEEPEGEVVFQLPNNMTGEKSICPPNSTVIGISENYGQYGDIIWGASPNLTIQFLNERRDSIEVGTLIETDTLGWLSLKVLRGKCDWGYYWTKIRIGPPPVPLLINNTNACQPEICLLNEYPELFEIKWDIFNWDSIDYKVKINNDCALFEFYQPPPNLVSLATSFSNSCGTKATIENFSFDCDEKLIKNILLYPNPAFSKINVEFNNLSHHVLHNTPAEIKIYGLLSNLVLQVVADQNFISIDITNLEAGIYFVFAVVKDEVFAGKFYKSI